MYKVRFTFWDGSKEDEFYKTKEEAKERQNYWKSSGYKCFVKKRNK